MGSSAVILELRTARAEINSASGPVLPSSRGAASLEMVSDRSRSGCACEVRFRSCRAGCEGLALLSIPPTDRLRLERAAGVAARRPGRNGNVLTRGAPRPCDCSSPPSAAYTATLFCCCCSSKAKKAIEQLHSAAPRSFSITFCLGAGLDLACEVWRESAFVRCSALGALYSSCFSPKLHAQRESRLLAWLGKQGACASVRPPRPESTARSRRSTLIKRAAPEAWLSIPPRSYTS